MNWDEAFAKLETNSKSVCDEAVRLLVKIADNIVKNPTNLKVRSLQKSNSTVRNKILTITGGLECLKLMGFLETDTCFVLPSNSPVNKLQEIRNKLASFKRTEKNTGTIPKIKPEITTNTNSYQENDHDLDNVKRFVLPPLATKFNNQFLQRVERIFHQAQAFGDRDCQSRAKKLIPLARLEVNAQKNLRFIQTKVKKERLQDPEFSIQDMLVLELLTWFKEEFFTWVDTPDCESCGGKTEVNGASSDPSDLTYTDRVEVYRCTRCQQLTNFPRYNDLNILLETRRGRCGEWAQVFTLLCRALGWDARYVMDELDHVWTEVYSVTQKRWIHCDPCENACDTPLMYETGWNKKLTYIMAYSPEEVQDVTWRYTTNHREVLSRRNQCTEDELVEAIVALRKERQKDFSKAKHNYLTRRLIAELVELMVEREAKDNEKFGRISGSEAWRSERGEYKSENMYVWRLEDKHIVDDKLTIHYSAALDLYELIRGDNTKMKVNDWQNGVYEYKGVFRKVEHDWKITYLARPEGTQEGSISWKYELANDTNKVIDKISLKLTHQIYENGAVDIKLISDLIYLDFPRSDANLETEMFSGVRDFQIQVHLSGGKGNVGWQHAQLFRQDIGSSDFPFILTITFKDKS